MRRFDTVVTVTALLTRLKYDGPQFVGLPFHLILPLVAAIIYVVSALLLKRSSDLGAEVWHSTRTINYMQAVLALPLWLLGGTIPSL